MFTLPLPISFPIFLFGDVWVVQAEQWLFALSDDGSAAQRTGGGAPKPISELVSPCEGQRCITSWIRETV